MYGVSTRSSGVPTDTVLPGEANPVCSLLGETNAVTHPENTELARCPAGAVREYFPEEEAS